MSEYAAAQLISVALYWAMFCLLDRFVYRRIWPETRVSFGWNLIMALLLGVFGEGITYLQGAK